MLRRLLARLFGDTFPNLHAPPSYDGFAWWEAEARPAAETEIGSGCRHCGRIIAAGVMVKQCPECTLVVHSGCYDDTEGGRAYQTPGCNSCFHRCYWR